jgi:PilZ domain
MSIDGRKPCNVGKGQAVHVPGKWHLYHVEALPLSCPSVISSPALRPPECRAFSLIASANRQLRVRVGSRMADGSPPKEHRALGRKRALLSAVGVSADGAMTFDCTIRDLSTQGGKIRSNSVHLPDRFYLINIRDQVAYDATVAWKRNGEVGLKWNNIIPLDGSLDGRFAHLRRIWTERAPR